MPRRAIPGGDPQKTLRQAGPARCGLRTGTSERWWPAQAVPSTPIGYDRRVALPQTDFQHMRSGWLRTARQTAAAQSCLPAPIQENQTMPIFSNLPANNLDEISHVIQLAVAPVFLLTAVGTLLVVLTNRLGRSVDRRRVLERFLVDGAAGSDAQHAETELVLVGRRVIMIYKAIVLAVFCALFICILIALAFVDAFLASNLARGLGVLFVLAMIALIGSLVMFLREIFLAVSTATRVSRAR